MAKQSHAVFKQPADSMWLSLSLSQCQSHNMTVSYTQMGMEYLPDSQGRCIGCTHFDRG